MGEMNHPSNSLYEAGCDVGWTLHGKGLTTRERMRLTTEIYDEHEHIVATLPPCEVTPNADGEWSSDFTLPKPAQGFYRVRPKLNGELILPQRGSMPAGGMAFAVVPRIAERKLYSQDWTYFGLHGNAAEDEMPWLGARVGHGWGTPSPWKREETYKEFRAKYERNETWKKYGFIGATSIERYVDLFPAEAQEFAKTNTNQWAWFTDATRLSWYTNALEKLAREAARCDYGRAHGYTKRLYEIEWEPELSVPKLEMIYTRAKVMSEAIKRGDPAALIMGPTLSTIGALAKTKALFEMGLGKYIDAYCVHAYSACPPEPHEFVEHIRATYALVRKYMPKGTLLCGTEDGCCEPATMEGELVQMKGIVRKNLIMLGEGFYFNCPFYGYDHNPKGTGDYGLAYNLTVKTQQWAPRFIAPRPVFPALSVLSWYCDGHRPTCRIEWLGATVLGYAFADETDRDCVIALWDWGGNNSRITLDVGTNKVVCADIMGRERVVAAPNGKLTLTLSDEPTYIKGISAALWSRAAQRQLKWSRRRWANAEPIDLTSYWETNDDNMATGNEYADKMIKVRSLNARLKSIGVLGCNTNEVPPACPPPEQVNRNDYTNLVGRAVTCVGRLAETGELLVGTGYPESKLHRFNKDGKEIINGVWPCNGWYDHLVQAAGSTWALKHGATEITATLHGTKPRHIGGREAEGVNGIVAMPDGWWLRDWRQGWLYYTAAAPTKAIKRVGTMPRVTALALLRGRVYAFCGTSLIVIPFHAEASTPFLSGGHWGGRAAGRWVGTVDRAEIVENKIRYSFSNEGKNYLLDPTKVEWIHREQREVPCAEPATNTMHSAKIGPFIASIEGNEIVLRKQEGDAEVQRITESVELLAAEGDMLIAYSAAKQALLKFKLSE